MTMHTSTSVVRNPLRYAQEMGLKFEQHPSLLRGATDRCIALHRYTLFGRSETCLRPSADTAHRFLSD